MRDLTAARPTTPQSLLSPESLLPLSSRTRIFETLPWICPRDNILGPTVLQQQYCNQENTERYCHYLYTLPCMPSHRIFLRALCQEPHSAKYVNSHVLTSGIIVHSAVRRISSGEATVITIGSTLIIYLLLMWY